MMNSGKKVDIKERSNRSDFYHESVETKSDLVKQEQMKEYYNTADFYREGVETHSDLLRGRFFKTRISKVLEIYPFTSGERVLDLGCAQGTFCFVLAPLCKHVTGVDYSEKAIEICNRLLEKSSFKNISFVQADCQDTGLEGQSFDVIMAADLLEHLYPKVSEKTLDECWRLLKKEGKLVIWTPHRGHIFEILKNRNIILKRDESHVDYKSMEWLKTNLIDRGFSIRKAYYAESHVPVFRILERMMLPFVPFMRRRIGVLAEK